MLRRPNFNIRGSSCNVLFSNVMLIKFVRDVASGALYLLVRGTDTVEMCWVSGKIDSKCWDICDLDISCQLTDGRLSWSVFFLTWALDSQTISELRLLIRFLVSIALPSDVGWRPSRVRRNGLPQKCFQLSINPTLCWGHHFDIQPLRDTNLLCVSSPR